MSRSPAIPPAVREKLELWRDAALAAPRLTSQALRHGLLPIGTSAVATAWREGSDELHLKVVGDALVRFLRGSGPVLTKLGQILATRGDLLPEAVCARLEALYTGQAPMSAHRRKRLLARAYPGPTPFASFEEVPLAVGSIGQVHRARLHDGSRVVVKLIRPGVRAAIRRDLNAARVFLRLSHAIPGERDEAQRALAVRSLEDLAAGLEAEADLSREADAIEDFRARFARNPRVYVPLCHRTLSSHTVLVMEELVGEPLSSIRARATTDPKAAKQAASLALREILGQIFDEGRFHGDPHGGNLLILEDGRLGLIDLGLTGELALRDRRNLARAVRAFLARDADGAIRALLEFGTVYGDFDIDEFKRDVAVLFANRKVASLTGTETDAAEASNLKALVDDLFRVAGEHRIYVPSSTALLVKTLVTIEGVARSLDPEMNLLRTALPVLTRSLAPKLLRWRPWRRSEG